MKAVYKLSFHRRIRLGYMLSLIFFVLFLSGCKGGKSREIGIDWKNNRATGIIIPMHLIEDGVAMQAVAVRLEKGPTNILGDYKVQNDYVLFQPLVPLTRGLRYEIFFRDQLIGKISVPLADGAEAPKLLDIYPSADSLPENLLKIYLRFSLPMQEGVALQNLAFLNEQGDTLPNIFLNLQQELWNKERTVLTLWLDPGRIKRDLIPNQEMGNPLQAGSQYTLHLSNSWKDVQGTPLQQAQSKKFFVLQRDDDSPQPRLWNMNVLKPGSNQSLLVQLNEPLDYFLLQETISIIDGEGNKVAGVIKVGTGEKSFEFAPSIAWQKGSYRLRVASHLEDLAGNNLVRPFDRDITKQAKEKEQAFVETSFTVE